MVRQCLRRRDANLQAHSFHGAAVDQTLQDLVRAYDERISPSRNKTIAAAAGLRKRSAALDAVNDSDPDSELQVLQAICREQGQSINPDAVRSLMLNCQLFTTVSSSIARYQVRPCFLSCMRPT